MSFKPGHSKPQVSYNGEFLVESSLIQDAYFAHMTRHEVIVEQLRAYASTLFWFKEHFELLTFKLKLLQYPIPYGFEEKKIKQEILQLINKGKFFKGVIIQLLVLPNATSSDYLIRIMPTNKNEYQLNEKGIRIHAYTQNYKRLHKFSPFYESDLYLKRLGSVFCNNNNLDDCLFMNTEKNVVETLHGNFFLLIDKTFITPPLIDGAMHTPMRSAVIQAILDEKIPFEEKCITLSDLETATELFICDTLSGIQWVVAFNMKRYFNKKTRAITDRLRVNAQQQKTLDYKPF